MVDECVPPQYVLAFFEFTTGDPHPLSSRHIVGLPPILTAYNLSIEIEVLGDYLLVSEDHRPIHLYLVSWKTGILTRVSDAVACFFVPSPNTLTDLLSFAYFETSRYRERREGRLSLTRTPIWSHWSMPIPTA